MLDFDCKYVLDVPNYMKEACWTGYMLELWGTFPGIYARLIFVYSDMGAIDAEVSIQAGTDGLTTVSLLNMGISFRAKNLSHVRINAKALHDADLSIDAASGVALALREIKGLSPAIEASEPYENIADFGGLSLRADDFMPSLDHYSKLSGGEIPPCCLKHFLI